MGLVDIKFLIPGQPEVKIRRGKSGGIGLRASRRAYYDIEAAH